MSKGLLKKSIVFRGVSLLYHFVIKITLVCKKNSMHALHNTAYVASFRHFW